MKNKVSQTTMLIIAGLILLASCTNSSNKKTVEDTSTSTPPETIVLKKQNLTGEISLPGELRPYEEVKIYARVQGFVKDIYVDRGSEVQKGEILASLEAPEIFASLAESAAKVSSAESRVGSRRAVYLASKDNYGRLLNTSVTEGAVSAAELLNYQLKMEQDSLEYIAVSRELDATKSAYLAMKQLSRYLEIRAPFTGIVTERNVHRGALTGPTDPTPLFRLESNQMLRLEIALPEAYTGMVRHGDTVVFTINSRNDREFRGVINRQAKSITVRNRVEMIEADIENTNQMLNSGSFAMVKLRFTRENTLVVPESAVMTTMQDRFIVRYTLNGPERVSVSKGVQSGNLVEIHGNISEGDVLYKVASLNL